MSKAAPCWRTGVPEISVILPFWNAEATLARAIDSIITQHYENWEMLLVDDGSTDGSQAIAADACARDPRLHILKTSHEGLVKTLQTACGLARAPFLARMDADDVSSPERFTLQLKAMQEDQGVGLCGTSVTMAGRHLGSGRKRYESWINNLDNHAAMVRELFVECPIAHPTFLQRRAAFDLVGGYVDHGWPEDYDLCMRLWQAGFRFAKVRRSCLHWTEHPGRLSMRDQRYSDVNFRRLKRHYLGHTYLSKPGGRLFYQWGAGEVGKLWLREWNGPAPYAVVDINPRKIGRKIHGFRVVAPEELPGPGKVFVVILVGAPGAREDIRQYLNPRGYVETVDYLFLA